MLETFVHGYTHQILLFPHTPIPRDRVPFVLTRDMAYVINDGDRPTSRFQQFVDLCCTAYNELRRHTHTLLSLLSLVISLDNGVA